MKSALLVLDTKDDRREIYSLLERISPAQRLAWLDWCCAHAPMHHYRELRPRVKAVTRRLADLARWDDSADRRLTLECWSDLWYLVMHYRLDVDAALERLVTLARGGDDASSRR